MKIPKSLRDHPPRKEVLLLSCMDLRLLDNVTRFMNKLNLQNRYDHLVFAGAAMGARQIDSGGVLWKCVFFDHLNAAINLLHREIKDIIILEHLDCGAYKYLHPTDEIKTAYSSIQDMSEMLPYHRDEAHPFAKEVKKYCRAQEKEVWRENSAKPPEEKTKNPWEGIRVRCLIMDLLGNVQDL